MIELRYFPQFLTFIQASGLSTWLGCELKVFKDFEPWVMNLVLCFIVAAATEVTSNTAICSLMMPIMSELVLFTVEPR
jgi:sodium-dependent dicarboxylate transporter 2/3/5